MAILFWRDPKRIPMGTYTEAKDRKRKLMEMPLQAPIRAKVPILWAPPMDQSCELSTNISPFFYGDALVTNGCSVPNFVYRGNLKKSIWYRSENLANLINIILSICFIRIHQEYRSDTRRFPATVTRRFWASPKYNSHSHSEAFRWKFDKFHFTKNREEAFTIIIRNNKVQQSPPLWLIYVSAFWNKF